MNNCNEEEKTRVAVLMGGMSSEHDVSMASGAKAVELLDRGRFDVTAVVIGRDGRWSFDGEVGISLLEALPELKRRGIDCILVVLHGPYGEDGRLQGMLDLVGIPYTSSGCAASALAMDKLRCKAVVRDAGVRVAGHVRLTLSEWNADAQACLAQVSERVGYPCVAKSPCQGSSVGMAIPPDAQALRDSLPEIFTYGDEVMVEAFVAGTEVTCAVLDLEPDAAAIALPVTEIRPISSTYFDYEAKYTPDASQEITPAPISEEMTLRVQEIAVRVHDVVGCRIWSRSDFIIDDGGPVWIEVNTVPGMTPTSLYPQAAAAAGIAYDELLTRFIDAAIASAEDG